MSDVPTQLQNMAQAFTGLPMESLIGGPLVSAAQAQKQLAEMSTRYILDTGFQRTVVKGSNGQPDREVLEQRDLEFKLSRPVVGPDGAQADPAQLQVLVPLLSCVPIQSLGVSSVSIAFDMEVKSAYTNDVKQEASHKEDASMDVQGKANWGIASVAIKGSASYSASASRSQEESFRTSNDAHYHVEVQATQQPVPKGLQSLLDALTSNIQPVMISGGTAGPPATGGGKKA